MKSSLCCVCEVVRLTGTDSTAAAAALAPWSDEMLGDRWRPMTPRNVSRWSSSWGLIVGTSSTSWWAGDASNTAEVNTQARHEFNLSQRVTDLTQLQLFHRSRDLQQPITDIHAANTNCSEIISAWFSTLFHSRLKTYLFHKSYPRSFASSFRTASTYYCLDRFFWATRFLFLFFLIFSFLGHPLD